jgi:hypothetical protein
MSALLQPPKAALPQVAFAPLRKLLRLSPAVPHFDFILLMPVRRSDRSRRFPKRAATRAKPSVFVRLDCDFLLCVTKASTNVYVACLFDTRLDC